MVVSDSFSTQNRQHFLRRKEICFWPVAMPCRRRSGRCDFCRDWDVSSLLRLMSLPVPSYSDASAGAAGVAGALVRSQESGDPQGSAGIAGEKKPMARPWAGRICAPNDFSRAFCASRCASVSNRLRTVQEQFQGQIPPRQPALNIN